MANYFSKIMPIKSFGIFAGLIIIVNYILVCLVFPSAMIAFERSIRPSMPSFCGTNRANRIKVITREDGTFNVHEEEDNDLQIICDRMMREFFRNYWSWLI